MNSSKARQKSFIDSLSGELEFVQQIASLAFKPLLIGKLLQVTSDDLGISTVRSEPIEARIPILTKDNMPLHRTKETRGAIYVSAIALKLQKKVQQQSAMEIAREIEEAIDLPPDFTIHLLPPGWIQFHLSESGLATWLQHLNQWPTDTERTEPLQNPQNRQHSPKDLFLVQYAHARCCSILRLGDREGAIALSEWQEPFSGDTRDRRIITPNPIPWLNDRQQMRLVHTSERTLIYQLVTTLDTLSGFTRETPPTQMVKLATGLSQNFLTFYQENRIWGEIQTENLALAQARLGLIRATQTVLKLLLEKGLGVLAPTEM